MRVLHVISDENIGGAGVLLTTLLRNFDRERVESAVALPSGSALCERIEALGIPIYPLKHACDRMNGASVREIGRIVKQTRTDLIHANAALSARMAGKLLGVPVIHTRHCCYPPSGVWKYRAARYVGGVCNRMLSDCVIATAEAAAEDLRALGIPREKIKVIINGSEVVRAVNEGELEAVRTRWNIEKEDFTVGICARLEKCKGHETFLQAAKLVTERMPQLRFRFLIVGTGSLRQELETLTDTLGLRGSVRFLGFLEDMAPIYRILRLNVNCSNGTETSCLAISEGMSASLPTVASDYGGNRAMIGESEAGILFPVGDAESLANAICAIAGDMKLETRMKAAAYERYLQNYTAKGMTEQVTRVYERLLASMQEKE